MRIHRYTQWDGTQQILFPTAEDILKHLSDSLLEEEGVHKALRDLMRRGLVSEDGLRSVKGMRDFLREAEQKKRELLDKYSPDSFKLTPEEAKALSEKLNSLAEKLDAYHEKMRNFMERLSGRYANDMEEMARRMQQAQQRYQELKERLREQISQRRMQRLEELLNQYPFQGSQRMGTNEAGQILGRLKQLEQFLRWGQRSMGNLSDIDLDEIRQLLGEEA